VRRIANKGAKCSAFRCMTDKAAKDHLCSKHRARAYKLKNPEAYTFNVLRSNAKRRGVAFDLTLPEFTLFCMNTNYIEGKGKKGGSMSIDRIDPSVGYTVENIQILTLADNASKMHTDRAQRDTQAPPF
jgi:hypothetical protein